MHQQETSSAAIENIQFVESLSDLQFYSQQDSLQAHKLIDRYRQSLAAVKMTMTETQIYSSVLLMIILLVTVLVFATLFNLILRPFNQMIAATERIKQGDFDINLPVQGFREIRHLNQSFNQMSSELARTQSKLIESEKLIIWKEIARMLAHEIKNPLTPINLSVQRMEEKYISDPDKLLEIFPEAALTIQQEITNLQNLARSFADFARIDQPQSTAISPAALIADIIQPYKHDYHIIFAAKSKEQICFDSTHFYQVVTNLLQNSIDACQEDCRIEIKIEKLTNKLQITFLDNGSGISPESLPKIFQPYFSSKKKGTGLGLAVVKRLVEMNNAEISVESSLGSGTKFILLCEIAE